MIRVHRFIAAAAGLFLSLVVAAAQTISGATPTPGIPAALGGGSQTAGMAALSGKFLENKGQWDDEVLFRGTFPQMIVWMTREGLVIDQFTKRGDGDDAQRTGHVIGMDFVGANPHSRPYGAGKANLPIDFFAGSYNPRNAQGVGAFQDAYLRDLYPGVDLRLYRDGGLPRWDVIVHPGADPAKVQIEITGGDARILANGDLGISTILGGLQQRQLVAFQGSGKARTNVQVAFKQVAQNQFVFEVGKYDKSKPLIIDPLVYGSYVGGDDGYDEATSVASNNTDMVYVVGNTFNATFPITDGPYGVNWKDSTDGFIFALQGDAYAVSYVAFVSGVGDDDTRWVQIDQYGHVWVAGNSDSIWFPNDLNQFLVRTGTFPASNPDLARDVPGGSWYIRALDFQTVLLPHNATAADIDAALTDAFDPPGPPAGWDVQGGPFAVTAAASQPIHVRAFGPLNPLRPQVRVNAYVLDNGDPLNPAISMPPTAVGDPPSNFPPPPNWGFTPSGGTFTLTYGAETTAPIRFDADGAAVAAALAALNAIGNADVAGAGGPLPNTPVVITFQGAITQPQALTMNTSGLRTGAVRVQNGSNRAFAVRFAVNPSTVLDPITVPVTCSLNSTDGGTASAFAIRPVATPTGTVQLSFAGTGATGEIAGPSGAGGFIASFDYVNGTADIPRTFATEVVPASTFVAGRSRYLGGTGQREVADMIVDAEGSVYLVGTVFSGINRNLGPASTYFATTSGIFSGGGLLRLNDIFVRKYSIDGTLQYSGVIGGSGEDRADAMALDAQGNLYVLGMAKSFNYPRTRGVYGETFTSSETAVVTKVSANGSQLIYSTNLKTQGAFDPNAIAVDSRGNAYIGGTVGFYVQPLPGLPTIPGSAPTRDPLDNAYDAGNRVFPPPVGQPGSTSEGWFAALNATATDLLYASYIGGNTNELVYDVVVDRTDSVWVAGHSGASDVFYNAGSGFGIGNGPLETAPIGLLPNNITALAFKANADLAGDGFIQKYRIALPILSTLTLNPTQLAGGLGVFSTGTVTLRDPAPAGGAIVTIRVLNPAVARLQRLGGPTSQRITIPAGQTTGTFQVFTNRALAPTFVDVRAELDTDFLVSRLNVRPWLSSFTLNTDTVAGGNEFSGTVTLFQPAPVGGVTVQFSTDNTALVTFPNPTLTIPEGQQSINFDVNTEGVAAPSTVAITATVEGVGLTQNVALLPATILDVSFNPVRVNGGESAIGTIRLDGKAVASTMIRLTTNPTGPRIWAVAPSQPATPHPVGAYGLMPGAGATEAYFQIDTDAVVGTNSSIVLTAATDGSSAIGTLLLDANDVQAVTINAPVVNATKSVGGGTVVTGTVSLLAPASPSGFRVPLTNSNTAAGSISPTTVFIPPGATSAPFIITTNVVNTTQTMTIRANKPGYATPADTLEVRALSFAFTITPSSVVGGLQNATGRVRLVGSEVAPAGGITVQLASAQPSSVSVPVSVVIPQGASEITFPVTTSTVNSDRVVRVTATFPGGVTSFVDMTVQAPGVVSLSIVPSTFTGGASAVGTVVLNRAAPTGGLVVTLSSNNGAVSVPSSVMVLAGRTDATFTVTSSPVASDQVATVTATRGSASASANVTVKASQFVSVVFQPNVVLGGQSTLGTVSLDQPAPPGGLIVNLAVVSPAGFTGATPPASVTVPAGAYTATFLVPTKQVSRTIDVVIRATASGGRVVQGTFRINPNPNP